MRNSLGRRFLTLTPVPAGLQLVLGCPSQPMPAGSFSIFGCSSWSRESCCRTGRPEPRHIITNLGPPPLRRTRCCSLLPAAPCQAPSCH